MSTNKAHAPKATKPFVTDDRADAFAHFAALVASVPDEAIDPWHYDAELVRANAARALGALEPHLTGFEKKLAHVDFDEVRELATLAGALAFVDSRVVPQASPQEIKKVQQRQRPKRKLALLQLEILRELELLAAPEQARAGESGRGPIYEARDGVAATAVFEQEASAIAGKHPFSADWLKELRDDSNWLLAQLRPKGAKTDAPEMSDDARARGQLWTELVRRHGEGKKIAVEVWGWKDVDTHYPSLLARETTRKAPTAPAAPAAPAAPGAPPT